ncbi:hypothetical protein [Izhakiella australiensis]|uniref:hypothetical protein n=1 Tax=Izhakiella australiensis TaxID=1926881 RepID=UPI001F520BD3|nr:hypothetical protein [Izhakiella australiensis]
MTDISVTAAPHSDRIAEFFKDSAEVLQSESEVISHILAELSAQKSFVSKRPAGTSGDRAGAGESGHSA